jgi:hypothetical protein
MLGSPIMSEVAGCSTSLCQRRADACQAHADLHDERTTRVAEKCRLGIRVFKVVVQTEVVAEFVRQNLRGVD